MTGTTDAESAPKKLQKSMKLFDVYAMATGAMFSSGLFLLPGIAASYTGNSVYLAYFFAGFLILPAMFCMAELSTAMPKSGGTYFFLDRALGPMMGTIGGLGSWVAVVFKSAFALVGMGAYLGLYLDLPFTVTAIVLTLVFGLINLVGAKETSLLQRVLVTVLVVILSAFVLIGLISVGPEQIVRPDPDYGPYFSSGLIGFISTIGLVFVSYAGLTKVASVAEEIENPERNIPLGMTLSLLTATAIYTLGTLILVTVLEPQELFNSLTPVADAGGKFLSWLPYDLGVVLIVISAIAAFASTGNAGIMSASRYPFAMGKDKLLPASFSQVGRFGTPANAIIVTTLAMIVVLVIFDVASVAKLASAFQLLLFGLICIAVIVMREARIDSYKPGFRVPLYPWMPVAGVLIAFWLIIEMGILAIGFTGMMVIGCVLWYQFYASKVTPRRGAIFHVHERLGRQRYEGIEHELMTIIHDRTQAQNLSYETVVARSAMTDLKIGKYTLVDLIKFMGDRAESRFNLDPGVLDERFGQRPPRFQLLQEGFAIAYRSDERLEEPALFVFRFSDRAVLDIEGLSDEHTLVFLLTPKEPVGLDLRIVGHLAEVAQGEGFAQRWLAAEDEKELNEILMRDDHFIHAPVKDLPLIARQIGRPIHEIELPASCLIVMIEREGDLVIAKPTEDVRADDLLAIIGEPDDLGLLMQAESVPA
ncbi:MAG: amino acid permease [Henriciella sp.]|nr:amino acid permease [Henriciella sp.]